MSRRRLPLAERLRVRSPCDVGWRNMEDRGGRDRHCARCDLTVHDVASMTRAEVEDLLEARERGERVCLHMHVRRSDGAVLVVDGHVERSGARLSPPSRMVAAAMASATMMTACASTPTPPSESPRAEIAVEQAPSSPLAIADPPPVAPTATSLPTVPKRPATTPSRAPAPAQKTVPAQPTPATHYELDGDVY